MRIFIATPPSGVERSGNCCTAAHYASVLESLGHEVRASERYSGEEADALVALHARRSAPSLQRFRKERPGAPAAVVLTGTDIYPRPSPSALSAMAEADRIVALQEGALDQIPAELRGRAVVIVQSAERTAKRAPRDPEHCDVCVVAHLREVKDPLLPARASRLLPPESRIRIRHAGGILEDRFREEVDREQRENPRYRWLGELDAAATASLIAASQALVLSSRSEGGARVVGEALVHGTPVLSTRTEGVVGLLGGDFPGFHPVGDAAALAALLRRLECDDGFRERLASASAALAPRFDPARERRALAELADFFAAATRDP